MKSHEPRRGARRILPTRARAAAAAALAASCLMALPVQVQAQEAVARSLAATCANCHGTNGNARGDMKPLAGMPAETMTAMFAAFRGTSPPGTTIMHQIAKGYTDEQIKLIAAYFAAQKPAAK